MTSYQTPIDRLEKEISRLEHSLTALFTDEANLHKKLQHAQATLSKSRTSALANSKLRTINGHQKRVANIQMKRAKIQKQIADKKTQLLEYKAKQLKQDQKSRQKLIETQKKIERDNDLLQRNLAKQLIQLSEAQDMSTIRTEEQFDFFISHASEDKELFVRDLADELAQLGAKVFYDEATLKIGDSLRRNIDAGLRNSRYGIVVLSNSFFKKEWPSLELNGLVNLELNGNTRILPIWHKVTKDEVLHFSPTLADKVALNTATNTTKEIAGKVFSLL